MGFLGKFFGKKAPEVPAPSEHAVLVHFRLGQTDLSPVFALEDQLEQAIARARAGEFDGNEVATDGSDGTLYMYGPNADKLFEAIRPILERSPIMQGATVRLRYGPPKEGVRETKVTIGSD